MLNTRLPAIASTRSTYARKYRLNKTKCARTHNTLTKINVRVCICTSACVCVKLSLRLLISQYTIWFT